MTPLQIKEMKKPATWLMMLMLNLSVLAGCSAGDVSFETRRDSDINFNKQRLSSTKSPVVSKWSRSILSTLETVNATNILNPRLASAILAKNTNGTYGLFVFWVENHPSVDGIEFVFARTHSFSTNVVLAIELKQVLEEAKVGIVFGSEEDWKDTAEMWKCLELINSTHDLKVRLLREKIPATEWFPVDFYKVDKWMQNTNSNEGNADL